MTETKLPKIIDFKTDQIKLQFPSVDSRLKVIIFALAGYVFYNFGKTLVLTELMRTQEEQDSIYKDSPEYQVKKWDSVHQFGRGADISVQYFTDLEQKLILEFLNNNFIYSTPNKSTALIHNVGLGIHLHLQVSPLEITSIAKI